MFIRKRERKQDKRVLLCLQNPLAGKVVPNRPKSVLFALFWNMSQNAGMTLASWHEGLKRYVNNPFNGVEQTPSKRTEARGNLANQLLDPQMSLLSFYKGLRFHELSNVRIIAEGTRPDGKRVRGEVLIKNSGIGPNEEFGCVPPHWTEGHEPNNNNKEGEDDAK